MQTSSLTSTKPTGLYMAMTLTYLLGKIIFKQSEQRFSQFFIITDHESVSVQFGFWQGLKKKKNNAYKSET